MTTFLGAMPRDTDSPTAQFHLQAVAETSVLPRILDAFAKLTIVPDAFTAERHGDDGMDVDIRVAGLDARQADQLAGRLRAIVYVDLVLVSVEGASQAQVEMSARRQA